MKPNSTPNNSQLLYSLKAYGTTFPEVARDLQTGSIFVSDVNLMGVLSVAGFEPAGGEPLMCGLKAWWKFESDGGTDALMSTIKAYYEVYDGDPTKLSFVRSVDLRRQHYKAIAIRAKIAKSEHGPTSRGNIRR